METDSQLGTDEMSVGKITYLIMFSMLFLVLAYFSINAPESIKVISQTYLILGIMGFVIFVTSKVINVTKGIDYPNPIIVEKTHLFGEYDRKTMTGVIIFSVMMGGIVLFASLQASMQIFGMPLFQSLSTELFVSREVTLLLTFAAAVIEDLLFFGVIPAFIFGIIYFASRENFWAGMIGSFFVSPFLFLAYHSFRYGFVSIASDSILMMGFMMVAWTLVMRNLILPLFLHSSNNIGITIQQLYDVSSVRLIFIIAIIIIFVAVLLVWWKRRNK